jgi:hypothetical protein
VTVVPVAGGTPREIHREASTLHLAVTWTPDGAHLVAVRNTGDTRKRQAVLIPIAGGAVRPIDLPDTVNAPVAVNPNGRHFAYQMGERLEEVWVLENFLPTARSAAK